MIKPYYQDDQYGITIYHGDCREILPELPKVDLVLTDPPYNFESQGGGFHSNKLLVCGRTPRKYIDNLKALSCTEFDPQEFLSLIKRNVNNLVITCNKSLITDYILFAQENSFTYDIHVIYKTNPIPARNNHFLHNFEYVVVIRNKNSFWNSELPTDKYNKLYQTICSPNNLHPAEKDVAFCVKYSEILSNDTILDPFMGSGTTLVAAKQLNRKAIGIEIEEKYCEIAVKRLQQGVFQF